MKLASHLHQTFFFQHNSSFKKVSYNNVESFNFDEFEPPTFILLFCVQAQGSCFDHRQQEGQEILNILCIGSWMTLIL